MQKQAFMGLIQRREAVNCRFWFELRNQWFQFVLLRGTVPVAAQLNARHRGQPGLAGHRRRLAHARLEQGAARGGAAPANKERHCANGPKAWSDRKEPVARAGAAARRGAGQRASLGVRRAGHQRDLRHRGDRPAQPPPPRCEHGFDELTSQWVGWLHHAGQAPPPAHRARLTTGLQLVELLRARGQPTRQA